MQKLPLWLAKINDCKNYVITVILSWLFMKIIRLLEFPYLFNPKTTLGQVHNNLHMVGWHYEYIMTPLFISWKFIKILVICISTTIGRLKYIKIFYTIMLNSIVMHIIHYSVDTHKLYWINRNRSQSSWNEIIIKSMLELAIWNWPHRRPNT